MVDDVLPPWKPRFIEVRGTVQAEASGGKAINEEFVPEILRLTPTYITSFGVNDEGIIPRGQQKPSYNGRKIE